MKKLLLLFSIFSIASLQGFSLSQDEMSTVHKIATELENADLEQFTFALEGSKMYITQELNDPKMKTTFKMLILLADILAKSKCLSFDPITRYTRSEDEINQIEKRFNIDAKARKFCPQIIALMQEIRTILAERQK